LKFFAEAIADCDLSLGSNSKHHKAFRTRARAHLALSEYEEAVKDFERAYELAPSGSSDEEAIRNELNEAKIKEKRSKRKDYYKVLGVVEAATDDEIKKSYRKMSLIHHPDKGGDEAKFKEVSLISTFQRFLLRLMMG
jgi:DnaJ homolog subfamily C member 7